MARGSVQLLIGPVGAGKTTLARRRVASAPGVLLDVDTWMVRLYGDDPRPADVLPWYLERRDRCRELAWAVAEDVLASGTTVWLELGLVAAAERQAWYQRIHAADLALAIWLVDAPRDVRRARVAARNQAGAPFTQQVPPAFFERASDAWEPPDEHERATWRLRDA